MNWFHKHDWKEIARTYAPRIPLAGFTARVASEVMVRLYQAQLDAARGRTTILWECTVCQAFRKEELLGQSIEPGVGVTFDLGTKREQT